MGKVICVGLGPGDPELMSVKADRLIRSARHVAYFRKAGRAGQARQIVEGMIGGEATEYPMEYPVTTEIHFADPEYNRLLAAFYEDWAQRLYKPLCAWGATCVRWVPWDKLGEALQAASSEESTAP